DRQDYDSVDYLANVAMGSFLMPGIKAGYRGAKVGATKLNNRLYSFLEAKSPETRSKFTNYMLNTVYEGKSPDIGTMKKAVVEESNFSPDEGMTAHGRKYEYKPMDIVDARVPEGSEFYI